ncbi:hypothetical protein HMSSN036_75110 [Paenibacillus macerans]|nr:hypothetical protein HMSSN036_75110 [Paenibacillus macerans]
MRYCGKRTGERKYFQYIRDHMDYFIGEDGSVRGYRQDEYNIDHLNNGKLLFLLHRETGLEKYRQAAALLRSQLAAHPRTSEGAFGTKRFTLIKFGSTVFTWGRRFIWSIC